jgi:hypothetical protein
VINLKCLECFVELHSSDVEVMEDGDLQLCDSCESEMYARANSLNDWDFLRLQLSLLKLGDNKVTSQSADVILKFMDRIQMRTISN